MFDENHNVVVADWRAPISTIYYDGEIGKTEYSCPEGIISGELLLKRQYQIENGELLNYTDISVFTNDELLQQCLKENSDIRLKNIVATIQKEQNRIIRANMFKPLIVQGVAGSGKTTVAIHRIAYLIYTYEKEFIPEEFLIIAPNKFFLDYIKNSLPDLGVEYVRQETFEELAQKIIKEKIQIENSNKNLIKIVETKNNEQEKEVLMKTTKFKGSLQFKEAIDEYLKEINLNILPKNDFYISGIKVIPYKKLMETLLDNYERYPLKVRIEKLEKYMNHETEKISEIVINNIIEKRTKQIESIDINLSEEEKTKKRIEIFEEHEKNISNLIKNKGAKIIKEYIRKIKIPSPTKIYNRVISDKELLVKYTNYETVIHLNKESKEKGKIISYEDLAGILHIQYRLYDEKISLKHIVIDEAQDFSEFQFFALNEILHNNKSLTILGDIAQGIYEYRGTNNWNKINQKIFNNEANIEYLKQSYRTTSEIMEKANNIIEPLTEENNIMLAEPVSRHGEKIHYRNTCNEKEKEEQIKKDIKEIQQKGYKNIAIIGKDNNICNKLYKNLKQTFKNVKLISDKSNEYLGGITILPSYYSKGLEFDSVIIADYNKYSDEDLDRKLLYVALTRAMHTLYIYNN